MQLDNSIHSSPVNVTRSSLIELSQMTRGLSLKSTRISALQAGDYQSALKGRGMEYDESRLYQAGDDIRNIDWRVTARTGKAHTKLFREERERPVHLWIDFRRPMFFATRGKFKSVITAEIASLLAWTANRQGDRVGGMVFSENDHHELKPQRGKSAVLRLIKLMVEHPAWAGKNPVVSKDNGLVHSLLNMRRLLRPGSLLIMVSDFRGLNEEVRSHILRLRQHNEVILVHVYDWLETSLPPSGQYRVTNGERDFTFDTSNSDFVNEHQLRFHQRQESLRRIALMGKMSYISCRTEDEPEKIIRQALGRR